MPQQSFEELLDQAAAACGIEPAYWDIWGKRHETSPEVKQAILASLGIASDTPDELERSVAERTRHEWSRLAPPCLVASKAGPHTLPLSLPADTLRQPVTLMIRLEDGATTSIEAHPAELAHEASVQIDGRPFVRVLVPLTKVFPLGYHEIQVTRGPIAAHTCYIVTPDHVWEETSPDLAPRLAGITLSLYGLRSARNWGCGDFRDLLDVVDWARTELRASFVGLNPLHAIHNRRPFNTSPYLPNSVFYQNFLYLDVEGIEDYQQSRRAGERRVRAETCSEIEQLRAAPFVEYERVAALKLQFLKLAFARFLREWRANSPRALQFRAFLDQEGELLEKFATYCALDEYLHKRDPKLWIWPDWPTQFRDPASPAVQAFRAKHWRSILFYQYLEWQISVQLGRAQQRAKARGLGIGLYHDLALATDRFGSDLWAHRPYYIAGCRVGAPPDDFSPSGQDWGFPPPDSRRHRENGYRLFAESIRKNCRHGGALRIDHVMRFFRLYWIPDGKTAAGGAYVRELSLDYLRVLALESVRNQVVVVGEDLGTVEPEVRETLARFGILSYRLLYFEQDQQGHFKSSEQYPRQALVSSTTHDLPTLAGFWIGADIEARRQAGIIDDSAFQAQWAGRAVEKQKLLDLLFQSRLLAPHLPREAAGYPELTGELHDAFIGLLALTPSLLLALNQEDLTKETAQQNVPGTTWQYPNWGRKMRFSVEQLRADPQALAFTAIVRHWLAQSGRIR
jgi:4-alpha-glucanotransferase